MNTTTNTNSKTNTQTAPETQSTVQRYIQIRNEFDNTERPYLFFAFSNKHFEEGKKKLEKNGWWKEGEKIYHMGAGGFSTERGIKEWEKAIAEKDRKIKTECNPQDVYNYEHNNHESSIDWEGDLEPIRIVDNIFGTETAKTIRRRNAYYKLEDIWKRNLD